MSELINPSEHVQIPTHWKFKERDRPGMRLRFIDIDERFLSLELPPITNLIEPLRHDYFFDNEGQPMDSRHYHSSWSREPQWDYPLVQLVGDEFNMQFSVSGSPLRIESLKAEFYCPGLEFMDTLAKYEINYYERYNMTVSRQVVLGSIFIALGDGEDNAVKSPEIRIGTRQAGDPPETGNYLEGTNAGDWQINGNTDWYDQGFTLDQDTPNLIIVRSNESIPIYVVAWDVRDARTFVVTQMNLISKIRKIFEVPIYPNRTTIASSIFSQFYMDENRSSEKGKIIITPWRDIDRIVGVQLKYVYPLPMGIKIPRFENS